ncbi:MAG: TAXI family TRAP transporter solute-binding subunit, partial [Serratia liquefaciens]|nr:TAXI family TRAP transporter solute-binding subunit [Serratia liquefaciens]
MKNRKIKLLLAAGALAAVAALAVAGKVENADKTFLSVATASTGGTYYPMGVGLANVWSNRLKQNGIQVSG